MIRYTHVYFYTFGCLSIVFLLFNFYSPIFICHLSLSYLHLPAFTFLFTYLLSLPYFPFPTIIFLLSLSFSYVHFPTFTVVVSFSYFQFSTITFLLSKFLLSLPYFHSYFHSLAFPFLLSLSYFHFPTFIFLLSLSCFYFPTFTLKPYSAFSKTILP